MARTTPFIEPNRCNCAAMRKASRRLAQMYDAALAGCGLRSTQFAVLAEIARYADVPPTMRELADALVMDRSTLGQNLRPLERDGLISIATAKTDRRRRNVMLTRAGRARLDAAKPLWSAAQARFEAGFGEQAAADLRQVLVGIAEDRDLSGVDGTEVRGAAAKHGRESHARAGTSG